MTIEQTVEKKNLTLTDLARARFKVILDPIARFMNRLGIAPNTVTLLGLLGNTLGAILLARGEFLWGGILVVLMGPVDGLDGTMARLRGDSSDFGAFVDSVTDRYSELVIFGGLIWYYLSHNNAVMVGAVYAATVGSILVSYVRARGQSLKMDTKVGVLTRMERYLVLAPSLIFNIPAAGIWIIAVLANLTALQRIVDVRRQAYANSMKNSTQKEKSS
jgi:CDP-diacylglycerol---glycerol-3-phosphate 3-phosphatidyltransferase